MLRNKLCTTILKNKKLCKNYKKNNKSVCNIHDNKKNYLYNAFLLTTLSYSVYYLYSTFYPTALTFYSNYMFLPYQNHKEFNNLELVQNKIYNTCLYLYNNLQQLYTNSEQKNKQYLPIIYNYIYDNLKNIQL